MVNVNGNILDDTLVISIHNRGYAYGDALFETLRTSYGRLLFWEDHYFRLMASMRIMRMEIPMHFTMEFLHGQIMDTLDANQLSTVSARVKITVHRLEGGLYLPQSNDVGFIISVKPIEHDFYVFNTGFYEVDLYKDHYVSPSLLSTLKTNNKALHVVASIYAKENNLDNCLLLNTNKHVVEFLNGNLFMVNDNTIKTPSIGDGCLKGIMRKQVIEIINKLPDYQLIETSISPFELQKADELFMTNVITGVQPISKYRKKIYKNKVSEELLKKLNIKIRLD